MEKNSVMEERAKRYSYFSKFTRALPLPMTDDEIRNEINYLNKRLLALSREMREAAKTLSSLQNKFTFYANYKDALQRTITPITLVTSSIPKKKNKITLLQKRVQTLTEEEKEKIEAVTLWEKGRQRKKKQIKRKKKNVL